MSHLFLTWVVFQVFGLALVSWAFTRIGVHRLSLRLPYLVFSIRSYLPLDFNRVFSYGRRTAIHSVDPSLKLTHFLGEFPGLGLALVPDVVVPKPEVEKRCACSRKLDPNFCPGQGRTSDLGI